MDKLTLVAPPGPMAIPLAYMAVNNKLADVAVKTEVVIWENADQLKAYVAGKQGDFVTMPSNNSAIFYNKGLKLQLLDISVWNITYLITTDPKASGFADIKGQSMAVSLQGSVPDLMFQYIAKAQGLDPVRRTSRSATPPTPPRRPSCCSPARCRTPCSVRLWPRPSSSRPKTAPSRSTGLWLSTRLGTTLPAADSPIAGTVATASVLDSPDVIAAFEREYQEAVQWMLDNPEEAGELVETQLPQLGLKAAVMTASLKNITWRYTRRQRTPGPIWMRSTRTCRSFRRK